MITTVTLNPAVDKAIKVANFELNHLNRIKDTRKDAGGKGINVSKVIHALGGETMALGLLGGVNGQFIINNLNSIGIKHDFTLIEQETRTNLKLIDLNTGSETELNEAGPQIKRREIKRLKERVLKDLQERELVVLAGSLAPGIPADIYNQLTRSIKDKRGKVILDTSGKALLEAIESKPYLLKPNLEELEALLGTKLDKTTDILAGAKKIYNSGIDVVVVSLDAEGSIIVSCEGVWKVKAPQIKVANTVGAGDTLVGALTFKLNQGYSLEDAIIFATAASANTVTKAGTQICNREEVNNLLSRVKLEKLNS